MDMVGVRISVPVASFRKPHAREYLESFRCPPPATVYGMLLSLVGEPNRLRHEGAEIALALLTWPAVSVVLRTIWRVKDKAYTPGMETNRRPDFQEVLTQLRIGVWVRSGRLEGTRPTLAERVEQALKNPTEIRRFGGLSLGESSHLVDEISRIEVGDDPDTERVVRWLVNDPEGELSLPVWADHVGSAGTRWGKYRLTERPFALGPSERTWTVVMSPEGAGSSPG